jgi:DNA polymerase III delta prime subunit
MQDENSYAITKLNMFYENKSVPHIIFHGPPASGKKTILFKFLDKIYNNDNEVMKKNIMKVNCSHGKGIKFIREELKFFAKTNIFDNMFKSIVLLNADFLTIDAQSALRRCIEVFSYNTRFFIVVQNKQKLLNPILSRFCDIYIPNNINLHQYYTKQNYINTKFFNNTIDVFDIEKTLNIIFYEYDTIINLSNKIYEHGLSALDIINFLNLCDLSVFNISNLVDDKKINKINMEFNKIKNVFRCEKTLIFFILNLIYL